MAPAAQAFAVTAPIRSLTACHFLQKNGNLLREERQAVLQLQQYLRRLDNSMDMDSYNAHETTLDDSARAYLESFRERGHRHQYLASAALCICVVNAICMQESYMLTT